MFNIFRRKNRVDNTQHEKRPSATSEGLEKAFKDGFYDIPEPKTPDHLKPSEWALNKQKELMEREILLEAEKILDEEEETYRQEKLKKLKEENRPQSSVIEWK